MDTLALAVRRRLETQPDGARQNTDMAGNRRPAEYIDFIVNGKSLGDLFEIDLRDLAGMVRLADFPVGKNMPADPFDQFDLGRNRLQELTFRVPAYYERRRVHLYGCPECGDLECGNVTVQVVEKAHSVTWRNFDNNPPRLAAYMSSEKSRTGNKVFELWQKENRSYALLSAYAAHENEFDYVFLHDLKSGKLVIDTGDVTDLGDAPGDDIAYPAVGPFEFEKEAYLKAFTGFAFAASLPRTP